ncbi:MAG: EamA family transporter, partial [Verrucomicrobiota bacterium]|nr:EamA family transporter [Verrucomicrobiota bacterium]
VMSALAALLIFASLVTFVAGQLLLKRGMDLSESGRGLSAPILRGAEAAPSFQNGTRGWRSGRFAAYFGSGIASMTVSFFLTLGLLQRFELSYLYPFQGLSVVLIAIAGAVMLRERVTLQLLAGSALISAGIVMVALS